MSTEPTTSGQQVHGPFDRGRLETLQAVAAKYGYIDTADELSAALSQPPQDDVGRLREKLKTISALLAMAAPAVRKARSTGQPGLDAALMTVMDAVDVAASLPPQPNQGSDQPKDCPMLAPAVEEAAAEPASPSPVEAGAKFTLQEVADRLKADEFVAAVFRDRTRLFNGERVDLESQRAMEIRLVLRSAAAFLPLHCPAPVVGEAPGRGGSDV